MWICVKHDASGMTGECQACKSPSVFAIPPVDDDYRYSRDLAIAAAERARIAHKMRTDYPQNKHTMEWADWIEREST